MTSVDDLLDRIELELSRVGVEPRAQRFALELLARGRLERVLHGADDDLRLDALFLGDGVDLLEQRIVVVAICVVESQLAARASLVPTRCSRHRRPINRQQRSTSSESKFHRQPSALDSRDRHPMRLPALLEDHHPIARRRRAVPQTRTARRPAPTSPSGPAGPQSGGNPPRAEAARSSPGDETSRV